MLSRFDLKEYRLLRHLSLRDVASQAMVEGTFDTLKEKECQKIKEEREKLKEKKKTGSKTTTAKKTTTRKSMKADAK